MTQGVLIVIGVIIVINLFMNSGNKGGSSVSSTDTTDTVAKENTVTAVNPETLVNTVSDKNESK